jgi:nucleotide-binding universal stress UspA family protein
MSRPILVGYDPRTRDPAPVRFGVTATKLSGGRLVIVSVEAGAPIVPISAGQTLSHAIAQPDADLVADCGPALEDAQAGLTPDDIAVECRRVQSTSAARGLHEAAIEADAGLLVVGSTRRGPVGRVLPGSTAQRLLHGAPCPIAVVPGAWAARDRFETIGVAYGGGDEGHQAVHAAYALARRTGATLRLLAVVTVNLGFYGDTQAPTAGQLGTDVEDLAGERRVRIERELRQLVGGLDGGAGVEIDVSVGDPAQTLIDVSRNLDLLVCGARGYGPLGAVLVGGVTRRLAAEAHCPVMVLPRGTQGWLEGLLSEAPGAAAPTGTGSTGS